MNKKDINPMPEYFDRYVNQVQEENVFDALDASLIVLNDLDIAKLKSIGDKVYAPGKWTIKDLYQHIIDAERVFTYRAMRFMRADKTPLSSFEDDDYAKTANANVRKLDDILNELKLVRQSTIALYKSCDKKALLNIGIASNKEMSALAIGFVIVGHQNHHVKVIKERYESLV